MSKNCTLEDLARVAEKAREYRSEATRLGGLVDAHLFDHAGFDHVLVAEWMHKATRLGEHAARHTSHAHRMLAEFIAGDAP